MASAPFRIIRFWTDYVPGKGGQLKAVDKVEYCAIGQASRSTTVARICDLERVRQVVDSADISGRMALDRWGFIKPAYEAWKSNNETPEEGTPLAAWPGLTMAQAEIFKAAGYRTVEDIAGASDSAISRVQLPGVRTIQENAKRFLSNADKAQFVSELADKDKRMKDLEAQLEEMRQIILAREPELVADGAEEPKRRGRPPKVAA